MQLFNIGRDIIHDSIKLGRVYVPETYLTSEEIHALSVERKPENIPNKRLKELSVKMIDEAERFCSENELYDIIPSRFTASIKALVDGYKAIGKKIKSNKKFEYRTKLTKMEKTNIFIKCLFDVK